MPDVCNQFRRVEMGFVYSGGWAKESIHQLIYICKGHRIIASGLFGIVSKDSSSTDDNLQYIVS